MAARRTTTHRRTKSTSRATKARRASGKRTTASHRSGTKGHASARARSNGRAAHHGDGDGAVGGPRPIWSGTISFGLVAVPVNLFPAVRGAGVALRMLAPDGTPLQRRYVCPEHERDVPWDELVRGYEVDDDEYVVLTDEELEAIAPRKSRDIDLRLFVPANELDPFLFERAYVLTPGGDSTKPYRLLAEVMEQEGKAGIATFVMRTKEYLVAILAREGILWAETLRFAGELRTPADVGLKRAGKAGTTGKTAKAEVAAFGKAIRALDADAIDRDELQDERAHALQRLVERKDRRGTDVVEAPAPAAAEEPGDGEAPDVFEQIRRSLQLVKSR